MVTLVRLVTVVALCGLGVGLSATRNTTSRQIPTQADLFQPTKVWDAHLTFTPDQWKGLEPRQFAPTGTAARSDGETWLLARDGLRNGWTTAKGLEFNYVHATLELGGMRFPDVAVRFKGNATYSPRSVAAVKNSYKIDLNKYVKGQKLAGLSTLNFHNSIADPSWMNEVLAYRLYRDAGVPAPRTSFVRLSLTVPGLHDRQYTGLYVIVENVDSNFVQAQFKSDAGAVLKPVTAKPFSDLGNDWARYVQTYDPKTDLTDAEQQRVIEFCKFVTSSSDQEFAARVGDYIDLDAFARYYALVVWINNWDSILSAGQNYYLYLSPTTRKLAFIPWDQDHSFGNFPPQPGIHADGSIFAPTPEKILFLERMMAVPAFRGAYLARMREFSQTVLQPARFAAQVNEIVSVIRPIVVQEPPKLINARFDADPLTMFDRIVAGQRGLLPFITARAQSVSGQLAR
jgi:spore coat protein H